jgi:hypothetical protein
MIEVQAQVDKYRAEGRQHRLNGDGARYIRRKKKTNRRRATTAEEWQ